MRQIPSTNRFHKEPPSIKAALRGPLFWHTILLGSGLQKAQVFQTFQTNQTPKHKNLQKPCYFPKKTKKKKIWEECVQRPKNKNTPRPILLKSLFFLVFLENSMVFEGFLVFVFGLFGMFGKRLVCLMSLRFSERKQPHKEPF